MVYCEDTSQYRNRVSVTIGKRERDIYINIYSEREKEREREKREIDSIIR